MKQQNLYWPIYMNLEKELITLSNSISFDDSDKGHQLDTYSPKISELLLRCAIEVESISKDLYYINGGERKKDKNGDDIEPRFDSECLKFLDNAWQICSKKVLVSSANFYFTKPENKVITPLNGICIKKGCPWNNAYQAVKHYRSTSMDQATVKNLIHAMASLYLLNIYYKDEKILYSLHRYSNNIVPISDDNTVSFNSEVFSLNIYQFTQMGQEVPNSTGKKLPHAVYIRKYTDKGIQEIVNEWFEENKETLKERINFLSNRPELKEFIDNGGVVSNENAHLVFQHLGKPLLDKMNLLNTFDEKKKFVTEQPYFDQLSYNTINQMFPDKDISFQNKKISKNNIETICVVLGALEASNVINSEYALGDDFEYKTYIANGGIFNLEHFYDMVQHFGKPLLSEMNKLSVLDEKIKFLQKQPLFSTIKSSYHAMKKLLQKEDFEFDGENITSKNIEQICLLVGTQEFIQKNADKKSNKESKNFNHELLNKSTMVVLNKGQRLYENVVLPADWIF